MPSAWQHGALDEVLLARSGRVLPLEASPGHDPPRESIATLSRNLESLGYALGADVIENLKGVAAPTVGEFGVWLLQQLRHELGAHVAHEPFYPGFPEEVMEAEEAELYLNALLHYWSSEVGARIFPESPRADRDSLAAGSSLRKVELASEADRLRLISDLLLSQVSLSAGDQADVRKVTKTDPEVIVRCLTDENLLRLKNRENLAFTAGLLWNSGAEFDRVASRMRSATDVLRLAVALSDGDVSLAQPCLFRSFRRGERRRLLALLERSLEQVQPLEPAGEMPERSVRWKRLGERLHPGEYAVRFPLSAAAFRMVRNGETGTSFESRLHRFEAAGDYAGVADLLRSRPGSFARRLDSLARQFPESHDRLVRDFAAVASLVPPHILLQLQAHFDGRSQQKETRLFFPRGGRSSAWVTRSALEPLPGAFCDSLQRVCLETLEEVFSLRRPLGRVFVDPELKAVAVPLTVRNRAGGMHTLGRGSRLALPDSATLRMFLWWRDGEGRTDLDLSALALTDDLAPVAQISFSQLRTPFGVHSGDIVSAPDGAAEFIDIDIEKARAAGVRYVVATVMCFTFQNLADLPECFAGLMARESPQSGEVFEPSTVVTRFDLSAEGRTVAPFVLDLELNTMIWLDLPITSSLFEMNALVSKVGIMKLLTQATFELSAPTLYNLLLCHAHARGTIVDDPAHADLVFSSKGAFSPFDVGDILANYL